MNSRRYFDRIVLCMIAAATAAFAQVTINPPTRSFTNAGGGGSITTAGSGTWTAATTASWLHLTPRTTGTAGTSCIYVVDANLSADTRQGVITIGTYSHTVTQTGYSATLSPTTATIDLNGGTRTISVSLSAGVSWSASTSADWITVTTPSGYGSGTVAYTVAAYSGVVTRTGSITIGSQTFTVTQTGTDVNISPYSVQKAYSSDIIMVQVAALSTTSWNVTSNASWISVVDAGNKFGNSTVTLGIGTNPSFLERSGTVTIGSATFTIRQSGTPNPIIDILPKTATADPIGAYGNIAVIATPDAPWTSESLSSWITATSLSGAGNGNIGYVASANPTLSPRTGTVRVYAPAVLPQVDLTLSLLAHVPTGATDVSGWLRHLSGPIETRMDGSFYRALSGQDIQVDQDAATVALRFQLDTVSTIQRLFGVNANGTNTALYVDANNHLVLQTGSTVLTSTFTVAANKEYEVVATASTANRVNLYAGEVGGTIGLVASSTFTSAPFHLSVATATAAVKLGYTDLPSTGYLHGGVLKDFRLYGRALSSDEATALFTASLSSTPYGTADAPVVNPVVSYNMRGQAMPTGGLLALTSSPAISVNVIGTYAGLTDTWSQIASANYSANAVIMNMNTDVAVPVTSRMTDNGYSWYYPGSQSIFVRVKYIYEDGVNYTGSDQSVTVNKSTGFTSSGENIQNSKTLIFYNPYPSKWIASISVYAKYERSGDVRLPS